MVQAIFLTYKIRPFSWTRHNCGFNLQEAVTATTTTITQRPRPILLPSVLHPLYREETSMIIVVAPERYCEPLPFFCLLASVCTLPGRSLFGGCGQIPDDASFRVRQVVPPSISIICCREGPRMTFADRNASATVQLLLVKLPPPSNFRSLHHTVSPNISPHHRRQNYLTAVVN